MHPVQKRLIFRLTSLGDVILATAALEVRPEAGRWDWVVSAEYGSLFQGHPRVGKLWKFDRRKSGLVGWIKFCRQIWQEQYEEIYDLHGSLRTRIARILFFIWDLQAKRPEVDRAKWKKISKERLRFYGYCMLKRLWPKRLRPTRYVERFSHTVGGTGSERPNLAHLVQPGLLPNDLRDQPYICVMPSSRWEGKRWAAEKFLAVFKTLPVFPVVLGSSDDPSSARLVKLLEREGIDHFSGVGKWDLADGANVLAHSIGYLGNDTGMAHLAEAVGVPALVIMGPTTSDIGFGPWRAQSRAIETKLWCRPCGKDGRFCFRFKERFLCLKSLKPELVMKALQEGQD